MGVLPFIILFIMAKSNSHSVIAILMMAFILHNKGNISAKEGVKTLLGLLVLFFLFPA